MRYLVHHVTSGDTFVIDDTHSTGALYYTDWREPDTDALRPDLDLFDFDLDEERPAHDEDSYRYHAEQAIGEPIHLLT